VLILEPVFMSVHFTSARKPLLIVTRPKRNRLNGDRFINLSTFIASP
jgi:hypothetical protein